MRALPRFLLAATIPMIFATTSLLANGGAWQTGVPLTGNGAPSDKKRSTEVAIEEENLSIDLHQEFAVVEIRYRMHNTGSQVLQDFFFPVERWTPEEGEHDTDATAGKPTDLEDYRIAADNSELKWKNVDSGEKLKAVNDAHWGEFPPARKLWKKSEIPFAPNQTREITIHYRAGYSGAESSVSDDGHRSDLALVYSLSPAATWKGPIGKGTIVVNVSHPSPEEVSIKKPADRFKKISDTRYEWTFTKLEPTLADDLHIVAHRAYDSYSANNSGAVEGDQSIREYVIQANRYFLVHSDYVPVASSTLAAAGEHNYDVKNLQSLEADTTWAEGVEGDGIGESITLDVTRPLPLDSILIVPGYRGYENPSLWTKNNRVAEAEVTLNDEHTFTAKIPDEQFEDPFPIRVRDYTKPVKSVKLVIKAVHRGTSARDTCISRVQLKAKLAEKPKFQPAR